MFSFENYKKNLFSVMNGVNNRDINFIVEELSKLKKRKGRLIILGAGGVRHRQVFWGPTLKGRCGVRRRHRRYRRAIRDG